MYLTTPLENLASASLYIIFISQLFSHKNSSKTLTLPVPFETQPKKNSSIYKLVEVGLFKKECHNDKRRSYDRESNPKIILVKKQ